MKPNLEKWQEHVTAEGYPFATFEWMGRTAYVSPYSTKRWLLQAFGIVNLGPEFQDLISVTLPEDPEDNRPETVMPGWTADPEIVEQVKPYLLGELGEDG